MLAALLASAAGAQGAISVTDAKIEGGKLVVSGTARSGAQIRLDGQEGAAFNARAGVDGAFSFSLVYHPDDCVVTLEALVPPYLTIGGSADGLVANCGPAGVNPRGEWARSAGYVVNDLVTHEGSTWRARRNNAGRTPAAGADWEVFAAAGEDGTAAGENTAAARGGSLRTPPTGPAGGDLQGNYPNPTIRNLVIEASNLASNSITNPKINNGAVDSAKIADNSLTTDDLAPNSVSFSEIASSSIGSDEVRNESLSADDLALNSVTASEIAANAVTSSEIAPGTVTATDIAENSIDQGEVVDFGLSNQDVGVLFAEVNEDGTLANSSGSVTSSRIDTGFYEVDFGRDITSCATVATLDRLEDGEVSVDDRSGNIEALGVDTNNSDGTFADKPFHLVVVC